MNNIFKLVPHKTFDSFLNAVSNISHSTKRIIWRGEGLDEWHLTPTLFRNNGKKALLDIFGNEKYVNGIADLLNAEALLLFDFYKECKKIGLGIPYVEMFEGLLDSREAFVQYSSGYYLDNQSPYYDIFNKIEVDQHGNILSIKRNNSIEELATVAQHNGIPTRLIDWTYDMNAALYFAANEAIKQINNGRIDGNITIWAFDTLYSDLYLSPSKSKMEFLRLVNTSHYNNRRQQSQSGVLMYTNLGYLRTIMADYENFIEKIYREDKSLNCLYFFLSQIENGILICKKIYEKEHAREGNKDTLHSPLRKITLPYSELPKVINYLEAVHANGTRYFPDYEGVYEYIVSKPKINFALESIQKRGG